MLPRNRNNETHGNYFSVGVIVPKIALQETTILYFVHESAYSVQLCCHCLKEAMLIVHLEDI